MRIVLVMALAACGGSSDGPHVLMDFTRAGGLYSAPVPSDDLRTGTHADVSSIPDPQSTPVVLQMLGLLADNDGWATTGGVFFQLSEPLDPAGLPSIAASAAADSPAFVIGIDPASPDFGVRRPLEVTFEEMATRYGAPNLVALVPLQGMPLRPATRYAAVLTTALHTAAGEPYAKIANPFPDAAAVLDGVSIAGVTVFTTGDPLKALAAVRTAALARALPVIDAPFAQTDLFADFCAYHTTIAMPDYQSGTSPFSTTGGNWKFDGSGVPIFDHTEKANLVVTIPRTPAPAGGYPFVVFVRTGGGGDRPLVDRGQQAVEGGPPIEPGEGPARYLARAGFAGLEVDGPIGGLRNTSGGDEQFLVFNVGNLPAMRDNIRESAIELDVIAHVGVGLRLDASACPGASASASFDATHVAIMGHSMGAWIAPLAAAFEPLFGAMVLSGAGGSWIENIMYKQKPAAPHDVISTLLHETDLLADDPMLTMAQWALEPADPQVYGDAIVRQGGRHVLMVQGMVDDYILPRIANATSLSFGLDLAGPELDTENDPRLSGELAIGPLLPLNGRVAIALPASANVHLAGGHTATAVVVQHLEDGIEDGHEVLFQTDGPKHQYQCFLASWLATGTPVVPVDAARDSACP